MTTCFSNYITNPIWEGASSLFSGAKNCFNGVCSGLSSAAQKVTDCIGSLNPFQNGESPTCGEQAKRVVTAPFRFLGWVDETVLKIGPSIKHIRENGFSKESTPAVIQGARGVGTAVTFFETATQIIEGTPISDLPSSGNEVIPYASKVVYPLIGLNIISSAIDFDTARRATNDPQNLEQLLPRIEIALNPKVAEKILKLKDREEVRSIFQFHMISSGVLAVSYSGILYTTLQISNPLFGLGGLALCAGFKIARSVYLDRRVSDAQQQESIDLEAPNKDRKRPSAVKIPTTPKSPLTLAPSTASPNTSSTNSDSLLISPVSATDSLQFSPVV